MKDISKDMIKAIRLVKGWTPDLRKNISASCNENALFDWIEENRFGIIGWEPIATPAPPSEEYYEYERQIWHVVWQVIRGR